MAKKWHKREDIRVLVAGVLVELALVYVVQLGTSQRVGKRVQLRTKEILGGIDICEETRKNVGKLVDEQLRGIAHQVVASRNVSV